MNTGDSEAVVNDLCHDEIKAYLRHAPTDVSVNFPWLYGGDTLRHYGLVSILKLVD